MTEPQVRTDTLAAAADPERMAAIVALAWRPAWSMRRRVGCLAPICAAVNAWLGRRPRRRSGMTRFAVAVATASAAVLPFAGDGAARDVCARTSTSTAESSEYLQQHEIDAGDAPGHQIRIYELRRRYTDAEPNCEGLRQVESMTWAYSDYTSGSGSAWGYGTTTFDSGDKWFTTFSGTAVLRPTADGESRRAFTGTGRITGGTGVYKGVRGTIRLDSRFDPATGYNVAETAVEYWIEK